MARTITPAIDRLLPRCVEDERGCWVFQGAITQGYGAIGLGGRSAGRGYAHRVAYEYFIAEVPAGLDLDHLCRNRACCNPWHLEPVSRAINVDRGLRAKGWAEREITQCLRGHEFTEENTRRTAVQRKCITCSRVSARRSQAKARAARKAIAIDPPSQEKS